LPLIELGIGFGVLNVPDYRGSSSRSFFYLPIPYVVYRGDFLRADRRRIRAMFFESERFEVNVSFNATPPSSSDDNARRGMPDLNPTIEMGPSLIYKIAKEESATRGWSLQANLALRLVIATNFQLDWSERGFVLNPRIRWDYWLRQGLLKDTRFGVSAGPLFATGRYHAYFYQVDPQFVTPTRPAFVSDGGYSGTRFTWFISKRFKRFWLGAFARLNLLQGAIFDDSPLVEQDTAFGAGIALAWIAYKSKVKVTR
jgi:outer membrane scaffolding protein for murein synthesis (MipA/OmpV family)